MAFAVLLGQFGMGHEAEGTCAIFHADDDHTAQGEVFPQVAAIVLSLEAAAMDPYHHWQTIVGRGGRGSDTEVETVFTHHVGRQTLTNGLGWPRAERVAYPYALPRLGWLRCLPTEVAHRRGGIGNGLVNRQGGTVGNTFHVAGLYVCLK